MWMVIWVTLMWLNTLVDIDVDIILGDIDMDVDDTLFDINVDDNLLISLIFVITLIL